MPDDHHPPVDHRVGAGRAPARVDPRLPHGRADHRLLRPRTAARVSRRARRRHRRDPGGPGGGGHHRRGRRGRGQPRRSEYRGPSVYHVASGVRNPFRYGRLVELVQGWFIEHPLYDADGQPIVVPAWSFPGRGRVQRQLSRASKAMDVAEKVVGSLPIRGRQADVDGRPRGAAPAGRPGPRLRRALRGLHRDRGPLPRRPPDGPVGPDGRRRPRAVLLRPGRGRLGLLRPGHPPSLGHRARPGAHLAGPGPTSPAGPTGPARRSSPPTAIWPPSTSRTPSSPPTSSTPTPGWPPVICPPPNGRPSWPTWSARPRRCSSSTGATGATSCAPSTVATRVLRSTDSATTDGSSSPHLLLAKSFPAGIARVRQHRALGHRTILITGALDLVVEPLRPLFDDIVCARLGEVDGKFTGRLDELPPIGEARALVLADYAEAEGLAARGVDGLRRLGQRPAHAGGGRAFRWPSIPRPSWPPSPAGGDGTSSTGPRPTAVPQPPLPLGPLDRRGSHRRGHSSQAALAGAIRRSAPRDVAGDEGPRPRAQPAPLRRLPGGLALRLGPGRRVRTPAAARRRAARAPRPTTGSTSARSCRGSAGRDLATLDGRSSRYFEDMVSFPFVPGHEVVGVLDAGGTDHAGRELAPGTRAVIEPVLGCAPRATSARSAPSAPQGHTGLCGNVAFGDIEPGLQTGFCADTGGGWSHAGLVAHASQLHAVPDELLRRGRRDGRADRLCRPRRPVGRHRRAGTRWPSSVPAPSAWPWWPPSTTSSGPASGCTVMVGAKHPHQRDLAERWAPTRWWRPTSWPGPSAAGRGSLVLAGRLTDGADVVFDCVGIVRVAHPLAGHGPARGAGWCWSACRAGSRSTWRRSGTAS